MATKAKHVPTTAARSTTSRRIRKIFGNIHEISNMPNLIEVQRESYEQFLRSDPATSYVSGLEKTLRSGPVTGEGPTTSLDPDLRRGTKNGALPAVPLTIRSNRCAVSVRVPVRTEKTPDARQGAAEPSMSG